MAEEKTAHNLIAETRAGDRANVVLVGAHLDSVSRGPGINDNGSGSAVILEIAEQMVGLEPRNRVRFVWFGAEEEGLLGSAHYVAGLTVEERARIALMINLDMVASPNPVRFVYDGDASDTPPRPGGPPPGSAEIERVLLDHFAAQGLATAPAALDGGSDHGPFLAAGIPAGGLHTGASGSKTPEQAAVYGGDAGEPYDACYHQACDTFTGTDNPLALQALDQMSDAAAHAIICFAQGTAPMPWRTRG